MTLLQLRKTKIPLSPSFIAKQLGISPRHFNRIENGEGYLTKERATKLAKLYRLSTTEIIKAYGRNLNE